MTNIKKVYRSVSSMKTGLLLLVLIALVSTLGSVVQPDVFFNTIVFKILLMLLLLNMTLCTINRLIWFKRVYFKGGHARQGWPRQVGLLLLHAGIILILAGGTVYAYCGQSEQISITTGDTVDISEILKTKKPFSILLNNFKIEFNDNGSPSQYYSNVTILEDGQNKATESINVNHPLKYNGIKAYQQSFGYMVKAKHSSADGKEIETLLQEGNLIELPGTKRVVKLYRYFPNFDPSKGMNQTSMKPDNPRVIYSVYENDKLLGVGAARFDDKVEIDTDAYVVFTGVEPYTVLKVKSDPGLPIALAGGLTFMIGVSMTLLSKPVKRKEDGLLEEDPDDKKLEEWDLCLDS